MASELALSRRALRTGLVSELVESEVLESALRLARKIADMAPSAVHAIKELARSVDNLPLKQGLEIERRLFVQLCDSEMKRQLMQSFLAKRAGP
jgi:enoyl-CoA hydratase/carnithine racemase